MWLLRQTTWNCNSKVLMSECTRYFDFGPVNSINLSIRSRAPSCRLDFAEILDPSFSQYQESSKNHQDNLTTDIQSHFLRTLSWTQPTLPTQPRHALPNKFEGSCRSKDQKVKWSTVILAQPLRTPNTETNSRLWLRPMHAYNSDETPPDPKRRQQDAIDTVESGIPVAKYSDGVVYYTRTMHLDCAVWNQPPSTHGCSLRKEFGRFASPFTVYRSLSQYRNLS